MMRLSLVDNTWWIHTTGQNGHWTLGYEIHFRDVKVVKVVRFRGRYISQAAKSFQSCPTLCDPIDGSSPDSPVSGILQARTLDWVAISFSSAWKWKVSVKLLSHVRLFTTPWTAAYQAPLSMGFSRQEYWSGLPLPSPINPKSACQILSAESWKYMIETEVKHCSAKVLWDV